MEEKVMEPTTMDGIVKEATWKVSHSTPPKPYLLLEITVKPFDFHGKTLTKLFKSINPIVPLFPGQLSPFQILEQATGVELKVAESIEIGQRLTELEGCPLTFEVREEIFDTRSYPRVDLLSPKKRRLMEVNIEEIQTEMSRVVVKFNAWHKEQKKMYLAEELGQDQMTIMPDGRGFANISGASLSESQIDNGQRMLPLQYIGLTDREGKELYHGNIVIDKWNNHWMINWSDKYAGFELTLIKTGGLGEFPKLNICRVTEMKFVGTIFENPELLKETKDNA